MTQIKPRIAVLPMGEVPDIFPKSIAAHILGNFDLDSDILSPDKHPAYALDKRRLQYDAAVILKSLQSREFHDHSKVIGILDVDLFVPILTYVYGESMQGGKVALVSLFRLKMDKDSSIVSESVLLERAAKVALHESGHLFDLHHCTDQKCLMGFSGSLDDLDQRTMYYCRYCTTYLRDAFRRR